MLPSAISPSNVTVPLAISPNSNVLLSEGVATLTNETSKQESLKPGRIFFIKKSHVADMSDVANMSDFANSIQFDNMRFFCKNDENLTLSRSQPTSGRLVHPIHIAKKRDVANLGTFWQDEVFVPGERARFKDASSSDTSFDDTDTSLNSSRDLIQYGISNGDNSDSDSKLSLVQNDISATHKINVTSSVNEEATESDVLTDDKSTNEKQTADWKPFGYVFQTLGVVIRNKQNCSFLIPQVAPLNARELKV